MDLTYSCAQQVLVLDAELDLVPLQQTTSDELERLKTYLEQLSRYATCSWMGRSWTLQEGALASDLWIQYAGRPKLHKSLCSLDMPQQIFNGASIEVLAMIADIRNHCNLPFVGRGTQTQTVAADYGSPRQVQFLEVWNGMIGRSTTQTEDLYCIVAK